MKILVKRLRFFVCAGLFILFVYPAKTQDTDIIKIKPFSTLNVNGRILVDLVVAKEEKMEVSYEGIEKENLLIEEVDSILSLKIISTLSYKDVRVMVKIFFDDLTEIISSSSASISSEEELFFNTLKLTALGGGEIVLKTNVKDLSTTCKTGGVITLKGKAENQKAELSSGGVLSAFELCSKDVQVEAKTKSTAKINVENRLKAKSLSGADILYMGTPKEKKITEKLGGKISPVD